MPVHATICIFCGFTHESVHYMCEVRQAAMIRRVVVLSTRPTSTIQTTIPELYRNLLNKETFIINDKPITVLDSDEELAIPILNPLKVKTANKTTITYRQPTGGSQSPPMIQGMIYL